MRWQDRHKTIPASFVMLERDKKLLLLCRAGSGYRDGWYSLPAGHLDSGESPTQAAIRECTEEVGIHLQPQQLQLVHAMYYVGEEGDHERISFFFHAANFTGEPRVMEPQKCSGLMWVSPRNLPKDTVPELRRFLACLERGEYYSEYGF